MAIEGEVVAQAEIALWVNHEQGAAIGKEEVRHRAWTACPIGSAVCGFSGVNMEVREDGSGVADVQMYCRKPDSCPVKDAALQPVMDRLRTQAEARAKKSK